MFSFSTECRPILDYITSATFSGSGVAGELQYYNIVQGHSIFHLEI